uniref:Zgc:158868 n=1 Tax=Oryzias latipes TaxID=8090 RepID=A0A3P9IKJ9_ORYLA
MIPNGRNIKQKVKNILVHLTKPSDFLTHRVDQKKGLQTQAALNMLTCCQAENFRADDILVAAVHPGWVRTHMGGEEAPLTTEDSVLGIIRVLSTLSSKHSGRLLDWEGNSIPW